MNVLTKTELQTLQDIRTKYYMPPVLKRLDQLALNKGIKGSMSYLHAVIADAQNDVIKILKKRKQLGKIQDITQASRATVRAIFISITFFFSAGDLTVEIIDQFRHGRKPTKGIK